MERVIVTPGDVRGLGNIVSPKIVNDFGEYQANVSSSTATVNGESMTVYNSSYLVKSSLTMECSRWVESDANFTVTLTLKDSTDTAISGATVYIDVNGVVANATTNSSGVRSFTINPNGNEVLYIRAYYLGTNSISGSSVSTRVFSILPEHLEIYGDKLIFDSSNPLKLFGTVTGHDELPVVGARVTFMKYNPRLFGRFNTILNRSFDNPGAVNKTVSDEYLLYTNKYVAIGSGLTNSIRFNRNSSDNVISVMVSNVEVLRETLTSDYLWVSEDTLVYNGDSTFDISSFDFPVTNVYGLYGNGGTVTVWDLSEKFGYNATYISETLDTTGVTFANSDTSTRFVWANPTTQTTDSLVFYGDITCDFDFISYSGTITFMLVNENSESFSKRLTGSNYHIRLEYSDGVVHWFVDDVEDGTGTSFTAGKYSVRIYLGAGGSVKIKDFVIGGY